MIKSILNVILTSLVLTAAFLAFYPANAMSGKKEKSVDEPLPPMSENAPLEIEIWGGIRDLYKIAVTEPARSDTSKMIQEVQMKDFQLSSLFKVLEPKSFLSAEVDNLSSIEKDPWIQVGAQGVVKCKVIKTQKRVKLQFALFEVARAQKPVLKKTYTVPQDEVKGAVHKWVNKVIGYYTGTDGVFGTRLLFARKTGKNKKHIYTADWSGGDVSRITKNNSINLLPAWGPGGSIYYTSFVEGYPYLYRTGLRKPVSARPGLNMGAAFYGSKMAVVLSKDGNPEIYVGNADGSSLRRLTSSGSIDVSPTFSPDGSKIAFVSDRHGSPQIFVMSAGGGGAKRITFKGSYNQTPSWCPRKGSSAIAFTGMDGGTFDIFTVNADGSSLRRLTQHQGRNMDPAFAPDCRAVAFHSSRGGIFISNPEGLNQNRVIPGIAETIKWSSK